MDLQLAGKVAVVTGSTGGIGRAIATEFARYKAITVVNGRTKESCDKAIAGIAADAGVSADSLIGVPGDVANADGAAAFVAALREVEAKHGPVEVLVNNVGIFHVQNFQEIPDSKWLEYYETNTMSGVRLARVFIKDMLARNSGRIIFISSECGLRPLPHMMAYSISKTSQIALSRGLAEMTKGTKVTVNCILPGPTMTEGVKTYIEDFGKSHGINDRDEAIAR